MLLMSICMRRTHRPVINWRRPRIPRLPTSLSLTEPSRFIEILLGRSPLCWLLAGKQSLSEGLWLLRVVLNLFRASIVSICVGWWCPRLLRLVRHQEPLHAHHTMQFPDLDTTEESCSPSSTPLIHDIHLGIGVTERHLKQGQVMGTSETRKKHWTIVMETAVLLAITTASTATTCASEEPGYPLQMQTPAVAEEVLKWDCFTCHQVTPKRAWASQSVPVSVIEGRLV